MLHRNTPPIVRRNLSAVDHLMYHLFFLDGRAPDVSAWVPRANAPGGQFPTTPVALFLRGDQGLDTPFWRVMLPRYPLLLEWRGSGGHRRVKVPDAWPDDVQQVLAAHDMAHITPRRWARACFPHGTSARRIPELYAPAAMPGLSTLAAYAHGWPVQRRHKALMAPALLALMDYPPFVLWALNVAVEAIPPTVLTRTTSHHTQLAWIDALLRRDQVATDPLAVSRFVWTQCLPEWSWDTTNLRKLPRLAEWTDRSSRRVLPMQEAP